MMSVFLRSVIVFLTLTLAGGVSETCAQGGGQTRELSPLDLQSEIIENYSYARELYDSIGLEDVVNFRVFEQAIFGLSKMKFERQDIITLVDFSLPSTTERIFVIDLENHELIYKSHVAHGKNTGGNYATSFSNKNGSNQSSLGFFKAVNSYDGRNGYSLKLHGLEQGINDNAFERAIVIHGAYYCDPADIPNNGRLGRSQGCFALPIEINEELIDRIKGGSMLYAYSDDKEYQSGSTVISAHNKALAAAHK